MTGADQYQKLQSPSAHEAFEAFEAVVDGLERFVYGVLIRTVRNTVIADIDCAFINNTWFNLQYGT